MRTSIFGKFSTATLLICSRFWRGLYCRFETGAHPREPVIDLLGLTACQTSSLEDHGRQLQKTIGYYTNKISGAKAVGAVVKALTPAPSSPLSAASISSRQNAPAPPSRSASQMMSINDTPFLGGASNNVSNHSNVSNHNNVGNNSNDIDKVEKKFADLKTSIMEKCQPSST